MLLLLGVLGALYFALTDPRFGPAGHARPQGALDVRHWLHVLRASPENTVDAANTAWPVTLVGLAGSVALLGVGIWLLTRRTV